MKQSRSKPVQSGIVPKPITHSDVMAAMVLSQPLGPQRKTIEVGEPAK